MAKEKKPEPVFEPYDVSGIKITEDVTSLGEGLKLVSDDCVPFTVELAERLLTFEEIEGDRPLRDNHVEALIRAMMRGTFLFEQAALVVCRVSENGKELRMNGQHTAWAKISVKGLKGPPPKIRYMVYQAKTMDDARRLYASIDRNAPRTKANVVDSYLAGTEELGEFHPKIRRVLSAGLALWLWEGGHERSKHDGDSLSYLMRTTHLNSSRVIATTMQDAGTADRQFLFRGPVVAAMYATFSKAVKPAEEFWRGVMTGEELNTKDPRLKLRDALMRSRLIVRARGATKAVSGEEMFRQCLHAWNAFRRGEKLEVLRAPLGSPRPAVK